MLKTLHHLRALVASTTIAALLALLPAGATPARAQAAQFFAEITKIEIADSRVTLKASMGQQSLRVTSGVALDAFKPGDKVRVTFGQAGNESVITSMEAIKP